MAGSPQCGKEKADRKESGSLVKGELVILDQQGGVSWRVLLCSNYRKRSLCVSRKSFSVETKEKASFLSAKCSDPSFTPCEAVSFDRIVLRVWVDSVSVFLAPIHGADVPAHSCPYAQLGKNPSIQDDPYCHNSQNPDPSFHANLRFCSSLSIAHQGETSQSWITGRFGPPIIL